MNVSEHSILHCPVQLSNKKSAFWVSIPVFRVSDVLPTHSKPTHQLYSGRLGVDEVAGVGLEPTPKTNLTSIVVFTAISAQPPWRTCVDRPLYRSYGWPPSDAFAYPAMYVGTYATHLRTFLLPNSYLSCYQLRLSAGVEPALADHTSVTEWELNPLAPNVTPISGHGGIEAASRMLLVDSWGLARAFNHVELPRSVDHLASVRNLSCPVSDHTDQVSQPTCPFDLKVTRLNSWFWQHNFLRSVGKSKHVQISLPGVLNQIQQIFTVL